MHCSVENAAVSCVNQRERLTQYWASPSEERKKEEEEEEEKQFGRFAAVWLGTFAMLTCAIGSLVGHENTRRWTVYCHKGYKFTVFEIWRDFNVLSYIACPRYPYIRVYRLYDKSTIYTFHVVNKLLGDQLHQYIFTRPFLMCVQGYDIKTITYREHLLCYGMSVM